MKFKKSIVLVLVTSLIVTTGIITLANDRSQTDETELSQLASGIPISNTYSPHAPKKHVTSDAGVESKKDKSPASRAAKPPADAPAQPGGRTISYGDTVSGDITAAGVRDEWTFEGGMNDFIVITMDSDDFDTFLELQFDGEFVASNDDFNGLDSQIGPITLTQDGSYTIIARPLSESATGNYTLSLNTIAVDTLSYGEIVSGDLSIDESALWGFDGSAGDIIVIQVAGEGGFTPNIELRNSSNEWLSTSEAFEGDDADIGPFTLQSDGFYFISVASYNIPDDETYSFELSLESVEIESLEGGVLVYGDSHTTTISADSTHAWTFEGERGDLIVLDVSGSDTFPTVEILRPDGLVFIDASFGIYYEQYGPLVLPVDGTYTVNVSNFSAGIYNISLEKQGTGTPGTGGGSLVYDELQTGTYGMGAPEVWTFEGSENDVITITSTSETVDINMTLLDADGNYIVGDNNFDSGNAIIGPFVVNRSATYTIAISTYDSTATGEYSVGVVYEGSPEPGGGQIVYDESQTSVLTGGLEDSWTFEGSEGDVVVISLRSDRFDTFLVLQDDTGTELQSNDDYVGLNSQVGPYTLPADGTYTIIARGLSDYGAGEYTVTLQEPVISPIAYGETQTGELFEGAIDFWTFDATATDIIRISLSADSFEGRLSLRNAAGLEIASSNGFGEADVVLDSTISETGAYTINVGTFDATSSGTYELTLEVRGRVEVGDGILEYGNTESGLLSAAARDEWIFSASENDVVTITLASDEFDTYLELIGPNGEEIAVNDDSSDGLNSQIGPIVLSETGTYTIIARGYNEAGTGSYLISLESSGTADPGGGELGYGDSVEGIALAGINDQWTFEAESDDFITIKMESSAFDTFLELYDPNDVSIASNDDFNGLNSQIGPLYLTDNGTYTIIARPLQSNNGGVYTLSLALTELEMLAFGDIEDDIQSNETLVYGLAVEADDIIAMTVQSDEVSPRIEVRDSENNWLYGDDDYEEAGYVRVGPFTVDQTEQLTVLVSSTYGGESGQFMLSIEAVELSDVFGGELAYGDTIATTLASGAQHTWTFSGQRGDLVRINMDSDDFDTFLEFNGTNGNAITTNDDYNGLNSQIGPLVLSVDGTYTIIARPLSEGNSGIYAIGLVKEGTGTPGTGGGTVQYDETVEGIYATGTPERWTFEGRQGDAIIIRVVTDEQPGTLDLYQGTDTYLAGASDYDYETNTVELGPLVLPESTTFDVVLSGYDAAPTTDYSLNIEFIGRPEAGGGQLVYGESVSNTLIGGLQDVWTFEGSAGETILAVISGTSFYTAMELQNDTGEFVMGQNYNFGSGDQIGPFTLTEDGRYRVVIGNEGEYSSGDYTLHVSVVNYQDIAYGDTIDGTLSNTLPHFLRFEATATDIVHVALTGDDFAPQMVLLDDAGNTIQYADAFGEETHLEMTIAETDRYTIVVFTYESIEESTYDLTLSINGRVELGDGELEYGDTENGLLAVDARDDWTFDGTNGETVIIAMSSENFDTYLELYDSDGNELTRNDDFDGQNSQIGPFTLPSDDTYTIIARGFSDLSTGIYSLSLDIFSATAINYGDTVEATIQVDTNDLYTLDVVEGDILVVTVRSADFYPAVSLRDPNNDLVIQSTSYSTDEAAQLGPIILNQTGTYLIAVSSDIEDEAGDYTFTIERGEPVESGGALESTSATGTLLSGARDEWTFDGPAGATVTITMQSDSFDTYLELFDSRGEQLASNDDFDGLNSQIGPLELSDDDTYTIIARGFNNNGAGTYTISLDIEDDSLVTDGDGNDPVPQFGGGQLAYGDSVIAQLNESVNDQWTFDGSLGEVVTITMESDDFDPVLELYDASNTQVARNDDFDGTTNARIDAFTLPFEGPYTIVARAFGNSASGEYTLALMAEENDGTADPETDIPDTVDGTDSTDYISGDGILLFGETETGELVAGTQDVFTFEGTAGDIVTILVNSDDFDTWAELRRHQGSLITYNNDSNGTNSAIVGVELPTNNTYQVIVKAASREDAGAYSVSLILDDGTVVVEGDGTVDGTLISVGDSVSAHLEAGTRDEWRFRASAGTVVTITLTSDDFDAVLELKGGPNGFELIRNDDSNDGTNAQIGPYVLPTTGAYTIVARAFSLSEFGSYTLSIEESAILSGGEITFDQILTGELLTGDVQEWTFEGNEGDLILLNANSDDFDTYLELQLADGTFLFSNDDFNGLNSQIGPYRLPTSGTFVVQVSAYSGTASGSYDLSLQQIISSEIAFGDTINGNLVGGQTDVYEFEGQADQIVIISMDSPQFDATLRLSDINEVIVTEFDDGTGVQIGPLVLPEDGNYSIEASGFDSSDEGEYALTLRLADEVVLGGTIDYGMSQTEYLIGGGQSRWQFEGTEGDSVIITMVSDNFDTYLALESPNGLQVSSNDDFNGLNSQIGPYTLGHTGTYTIVASGFRTASYGDYTLTLTLQNLLGEIAYNTSESRTLVDGTTDYWTMTANAGDIIAISVTSESFTPHVTVHDSSNLLRYEDANVDGGNAQIGPIQVNFTDEYTIAISGTESVGGDYSLLVEQQEIVTGGGSLNFDEAVIAQLEVGSSPRWKFEGEAGATISITMSSDDFDTVLQLVDIDSNEVGYNDDYVEFNSQIGPLVLPRTGTYFIVARGFNESSAGVYTLGLFEGSVPIITSGTIGYGESATGLLATGDRDRWTFEGTRGDVVTIELTSADFDTYLSLEFGTNILASNDDYDDRNSRIGPLTLPSDGAYTIVAEGYFSDASGAYTLTLSVQGGTSFDISNAETIVYGDQFTGELSNASAVWIFNGQAGDNVLITMTSDDIDSYLELYDADGQLLASNDDFDGLNAQIGPFELPEDGMYVIRATSFGNVAGSYNIRLELSDETSSVTPPDGDGTTVVVDDIIPIGIEVGQRAPNFSLQSIDGDTITLWDLRGGVVLINFWATWCLPCVEEMPALDTAYQNFQSAGFTVIGVDVEENEGLVRAFLTRVPVTFPLVLDNDGDVAEVYGIEFYPTTYIVDQDGIIVRILIGSTNYRTLRYELEYIGLELPETEE